MMMRVGRQSRKRDEEVSERGVEEEVEQGRGAGRGGGREREKMGKED